MSKSYLKAALFASLVFTSVASASMVDREMSFEGVNKLVIKNLCANVQIMTDGEDEGGVKFSFSEGDNLEKIKVDRKNGVLTLFDKSAPKIEGYYLLDLVSKGGRVQYEYELLESYLFGAPPKTKKLPTLLVTLSLQSELKLGAAGGTWKIGNVSKPFKASLTGSTTMIVGEMTNDVEIDVLEAGTFTAASIQAASLSVNMRKLGEIRLESLSVDKASFRISGTGCLSINSGEVIEKLDAEVYLSGGIKFKGKAKVAKLMAAGYGYININEVNEDVNCSFVGHGTIRVGNRPDIKAPPIGPAKIISAPDTGCYKL